MDPLNIIIAEDHPGFRKLLRLELENSPGLKVVGEVADGLQLLELLQQVQPDLIILDISMPNLGGLEAAKLIKEQYGHIKVLFLTMHKNSAYVEQARLIGAEGYLLKEEIDRELVSAISQIIDGERYISSGLLPRKISKNG
jgi:DNA-binding NarL/FixJ family response regulator